METSIWIYIFLLSEYIKRIPVQQAVQNLFDTYRKRRIALPTVNDQLSQYLSDHWHDDFIRRKYVIITRRWDLRKERTSDSEDSDVDDPLHDDPRGDGFLRLARRLYSLLAASEIEWMTMTPLGLENIPQLLTIQRLVSFRALKAHRFPFNCIRVIIGRRRITMELCNDTIPSIMEIQYKSSFNGCLVIYNQSPSRVEGSKYQKVAARDLFFLLRCNRLTLKDLVIDFEDHGTKKPFTSFFWKLEKHFLSLRKFKIKVNSFYMRFFQEQDQRTRGLAMIVSILPHLKSGTLEFIHLRSLFGSVNLDPLWKYKQWRRCQFLNMFDRRLYVNNYYVLFRFKTVCIYVQHQYMLSSIFRKIYRSRQINQCEITFRVQPTLAPSYYKPAIDRRLDGMMVTVAQNRNALIFRLFKNRFPARIVDECWFEQEVSEDSD